ncbi:CHAP domain-containing protein [Naasia lichenicola]|uniref:CHAP domain-containing protein n=1 Tax=Naasia lichenicola TaxID=2565933 RepID=UPI00130DB37F|nr:CHAP domain-containing protein [Naasia lichenicola]
MTQPDSSMRPPVPLRGAAGQQQSFPQQPFQQQTPQRLPQPPAPYQAEQRPSATGPQPLTRRELRNGRISAADIRTGPVRIIDGPLTRSAPPAVARPASVPAYGRVAAPAPVVPRYSAQPRTSKASVRRLICALAAVVTVPGLFATAALPAYSSTFSADPTFTTSVNGEQSLAVPLDVAGELVSRSGFEATTDEEMAERRLDNARAARAAAYNASGATAAGDDYPWPYEAADVEGGGLSPLGYYYRECVDFVAWRLNRDAGSTGAPWKYAWSYLTPNGGNASQWASNWRAHGWETGSDPVAGSVAWFNGNHVAYVKSVNGDGTVTIEEYNHGSSHRYGIRTIGVDDVALYLYAPPL